MIKWTQSSMMLTGVKRVGCKEFHRISKILPICVIMSVFQTMECCSWWVNLLVSLFFGKYFRNKPIVFSLDPSSPRNMRLVKVKPDAGESAQLRPQVEIQRKGNTVSPAH